jgi:hypothetical protein
VDIRSKSSDKRILAKLLAGFFASLFIFSTVLVLLTFFPARQLLNPDFYKQTLADQGIYDRLPEYLAEQLAAEISPGICFESPELPRCKIEGGSSSTNDLPIYLLILDQEEWESILTTIIEPAWLQTQTENIIDQFFDVLLTSEDPANTPILISMVELKSRLAGPEGTQALLLILNAQPSCTVEQLLGLLQLGLGLPTNLETLLCRPPEYVLSELTPVIEIFLSGAVDLVPDQLSLSLPESVIANPQPGNFQVSRAPIPKPIQVLRATRSVISISPLLPLLLISLVTIIVVRSVRDLLLWWGVSFLAAGMITLFMALILLPAMNWTVAQLLPDQVETWLGISNLLDELGMWDVLNELTGRVLNSILIPAGVVSLIGLLLLLGLLFLKDRTSQTERATNRAG